MALDIFFLYINLFSNPYGICCGKLPVTIVWYGNEWHDGLTPPHGILFHI